MNPVLPVFIHAIETILENPQKGKAFLKSQELPYTERLILKSWYDLRKKNFKKVITNLNQKSSFYNQYTKAHYYLIKGIAENNLSIYSESENNLQNALSLFELEEDKTFIALIYYNLFINFYNQKKDLNKIISKIKNIKPKLKRDKIYKYDCLFVYLIQENKLKNAKYYYLKLKSLESSMTDGIYASYLISAFQYFLKQDKYHECTLVLNRLKKCKAYAFSANYQYMKILLSYITSKAKNPIYLNKRTFIDFPELDLQINFINFLDESNVKEAKQVWDKLCRINSSLYQDNFSYMNRGDLFDKCLEIHHSLISNNHISEKIHRGDKMQKLFNILSSSKAPIQSSRLYQLIWNENFDSAHCEEKLQQLISRVRKKYKVKIKNKKGAYFLDKSEIRG